MLLTVFGYCLHGVCAIPSIVINVNIAKKSGEKIEIIETIIENVGVLLIWSVDISKYSN